MLRTAFLCSIANLAPHQCSMVDPPVVWNPPKEGSMRRRGVMTAERCDELRRAKALADDGVLDADEYAALKASILDDAMGCPGAGGPARAEDRGESPRTAHRYSDDEVFDARRAARDRSRTSVRAAALWSWPTLKRKVCWFLRVDEDELFLVSFVWLVCVGVFAWAVAVFALRARRTYLKAKRNPAVSIYSEDALVQEYAFPDVTLCSEWWDDMEASWFRNVSATYYPGQETSAKFPTSKAPISAVLHSFRLILGRAIISRNGLEAWMLFPERARAEHSR